MGWLLSKLAMPFIAPALAGALLLSVSGLGLTWWHLHEAKASITTLTTERDAARVEAAQNKTALSNFHAQVEMDRADANAKALASEKALQAQITTLTAKATATERARRAVSDNLLKALRNVPKEQQATLSPAVRDALRRVRDAQANPGAGTNAAGGGQDSPAVSAPPQP